MVEPIINNIEQAIIQRLKTADLGLVDVEVYPDQPEDYLLVGSTGVVLVAYQRSNFTDFGSSQEVERARFVLTHLLRNLRAHQGSYSTLRECSESLKRFSPLGNRSDSFKLLEQHYVGNNGGTWQYDQVYEVVLYHENGC